MLKIKYTNKYGHSLTFGNAPPFVLQKIDANSLAVETDVLKPINFDGQITVGTTRSARTIILDLAFACDLKSKFNYAQMRERWAEIMSVFLAGETGTLEYTNDGGTYLIECYPFSVPNYTKAIGTINKFTIELIADNPYWRGNQKHTYEFNGGSRTVDIGSPLPVPFVFTINGINQVSLENRTTSKIIKVNTTLSANQKIEIDMENYTVKRYDGSTWSYANHLMSIDSDFFTLQPGENQLYISAWGGGTTATIEYYDYFQGV